MKKIEKQKFVCLDCEMTGLDAKQDKVIEFAGVVFDWDTIYEEFETLIDPESIIPDSSIKIHNISNEMVQGKPKMGEVLPKILKLIGRLPIVGHGIGFDIEMLDLAAKREGIPCTITNNVSIDTLRLARLYGESPTNSLEQLRKHFNIDAEIAHRAMGDVIVNVEVFKQLAKPYKSLDQMLEVLSRPILLKEMPLGKHKGRPMKEVPLSYLYWATKKDFDMDLMYTIKTEIKKRKKGNTFQDSPFKDL